ncbi:MAG: diphthine synthase [Nitrososphaeria archaeon]|nr:diphthine synthase [Nitrososphaeria archaeon]
MLTLIGLGLHGFEGISLRGLETARRADKIFLEVYTSPTIIDMNKLQNKLGKSVSILRREDIEEKDTLLSEAEGKEIALICPGDPLIATTHINLVIEARKKGVETRVLHAASIYTAAIGESGLHIYKFGRMATLPIPSDFLPFSVYECIEENKKRGLHTILLLECDVEREERLSVGEALKTLLRMEAERKGNIINKKQTIIILSGLESAEGFKDAGIMEDIMYKEFPALPTAMIIPGRLHFTERAAFESFFHLKNPCT